LIKTESVCAVVARIKTKQSKRVMTLQKQFEKALRDQDFERAVVIKIMINDAKKSKPSTLRKKMCACGFPQSSPIPHEHSRPPKRKERK
jgi:hypothetical protein